MTPQEEQFLQAAKDGDMGTVKNYLSQVNMEIRNKAFIYTPSADIADLLKKSGANINVTSKDTNKHHMGYHERIYPALAIACKENYIEKAQWLIKEGVNLNECEYERELVTGMSNIDNLYKLTPLMWAVKNKNLPLIKLLINAGADISIKGHDGDISLKDCTALEMAEEYSYGEYIEIANLLKSAGAKE